MSKARLVVTAVTVEKRPVSEVARTYGVARSWIYTLLARYRTEGEAAFEPRSRRPKTSPNAISPDAVELIIRLRKELAGQGLDAGPDTIAWHLHHHHHITVSRATISRYLTAHGLIVPEPKKRPRSSYIRFEASQPNECWQSDFTHYPLADGTDTEILSWLDDHSRYALSVTAWSAVTGPIVVESFRAAVTAYGIPASTLTDNGMVFTTRLAGRERRPQRLRTRAAPPARGPEELPPQPPHHLRKSRTVPAVDEEMATRPARSTSHHRRPANPDRPLRRALQPAPPAPVPTAPGHPRHHLHRPAQSTTRQQPRPRHPHPHPPRPHR